MVILPPRSLRLSHRTLALIVAVALALGLGSIGAQPTLPDVPASGCLVAPLTLPLFDATPPAALAARATPAAADMSEVGQPVADTISVGITATVQGAIACTNAGDPARTFALFSEHYLAALFVGPHAAYQPAFEQGLARAPYPLVPDAHLAVVEIRDPRLLADGRVRAVVVTANSTTRFEDRLIFVQAGDRWLIDATEPIAATPVTPEA